MRSKLSRAACVALVGGVASFTAACGEFIRQDRAPVTVVITSLQGARGSDPDTLGNPLTSDVASDSGGTVNDVGEVTMQLILKDPGAPGVANVPSSINQVTITRYRVVYRRSDGRNTPGVDVPHPIDSALTFTIPASGSVSQGFELVRNTAKREPPLATLQFSPVILTTIADVTFYGRDQAGNNTSATGSIQVSFGNFIDD